VDQRGEEQPVTASELPPGLGAPRLSPDGRRIAITDAYNKLYVHDLDRGTTSRLTTEGRVYNVIWSPDGKWLYFCWFKFPPGNVYRLPSDGSSPMERLTNSEHWQQPVSWSPDGKTLAIVDRGIAMLDVESRRVTPFLNSQFSEQYPYFSPKGRWLAYTSNESGRQEVYVRAYPGPGQKYLVSSEGGREPLWARDGKRLFYRKWPARQVWAVDIRTDGGFSLGKPRLLIEKPGYQSAFPASCYDLSLDSKRFLMVKQEDRNPTPVTEIVLVQNWFEELERLVPAK
jgi:serine/threonine-protein kinase